MRFNDVNAADIIHEIMTTGFTEKQSPCKLVSGMVPVTHSCKAHIKVRSGRRALGLPRRAPRMS